MRPAAICAGLFVCSLVVGCGDSASNLTGTVTFDGTPIAKGSVVFVKEGGAVREGGVIQDGTFQVKLPPGKYNVEVNATKVVGTRKQKGFDGKEEVIEMVEEMIPERYNAKTELVEEVKSGANTIKLELKSKK